MLRHLPVKNPKPDSKRFVDILMGRQDGRKPPLVEYIVDEVVMEPIVSELLEREWVVPSTDRDSQRAWLDNFIHFWYRLGYDFVRFERGLGFPMKHNVIADTAPGSTKQRAWAEEHEGSIQSWEDFERYPWPTVEGMDFFPFEYLNDHLPEGMGLLSCHGGGIFEHLSRIMSLEGLGFALYDQPDLVRAVADRIGELMAAFYKHLLDLPSLVVLFPGDDMGFRTGLLMSPSDMRKYCLPWHKRFAAMAHERGIPYFLHSCGNLETIMEDLITDVQVDGKHSFEDAIIPIQDFQARYGDRIAVLGGMDVNILAASTPEQIRQHARFLMEICGKRGRFAIGSGNSIPSYIPVENYLAMVDEATDFSAGS